MPRHVKMMSNPRSCSGFPIGLRRPSTFKRMRPVATGGMTSGSDTIVSTIDLPNHCLRAPSKSGSGVRPSVPPVVRGHMGGRPAPYEAMLKSLNG